MRVSADLRSLMTEVAGTKEESEIRRGPSASDIEDVKRLCVINYASAVRECFGSGDIKEIISDARRRVWPNLNRQPLRLGSIKEFVRRFSELGVVVKPTRLDSDEGLEVLGFYVPQSDLPDRRPIICVNTAHHPAVVGAAFIHEMGHHLTTELFDRYDDNPRALLFTGYGDHLSDPQELAADVLVSLGIYPQPVAVKVFGNPASPISAASEGRASAQLLDYLGHQYGLRICRRMPFEQKLQCLVGLIHFTRLRDALRTLFDL